MRPASVAVTLSRFFFRFIAPCDDQPQEQQDETACHADIGHVEHREIEEAELDEVNDVPLSEAIDDVSDAPGDDKRDSDGLQRVRFLALPDVIREEQRANRKREHAERCRIAREYPPCSTSVVHEAEIYQAQKRASEHLVKWLPRNK